MVRARACERAAGAHDTARRVPLVRASCRLDNHFISSIFPQLTPMSIDPAHPMPFIVNKGYGFALQLLRSSDQRHLEGLLLFPPSIQRFIRLPAPTNDHGVPLTGPDGQPIIRFVMLEHVISMHMSDVFPGFIVRGQGEEHGL